MCGCRSCRVHILEITACYRQENEIISGFSPPLLIGHMFCFFSEQHPGSTVSIGRDQIKGFSKHRLKPKSASEMRMMKR